MNFQGNKTTDLLIDCDCVGGGKAAPPCMKDIGICGSLDPVACDQACMDKILASSDAGKKELLERIRNLHGYRTTKRAEEHGIGSRDYELITF